MAIRYYPATIERGVDGFGVYFPDLQWIDMPSAKASPGPGCWRKPCGTGCGRTRIHRVRSR